MQTQSPPTSSRPSNKTQSPLLAWHGWTLPLPHEWSPVKIDGDWRKGSILLADLQATRLAMRWEAIRKPATFDADNWAKQVITREVGERSFEQSVPHAPSPDWSGGRLFIDPDPPGRDIWVGLHEPTGRAIELVHQTKRQTRVLPAEIVARLGSQRLEEPQHWSIFDLSCTVPVGWSLRSQRLNAGDLTLTFGKGRDTLIVRQVRPATLALARQPIEAWTAAQLRIWKKFYRVHGVCQPALSPVDASDGRLYRTAPRQRRFFYLRWIARERHLLVDHDASRDALVFVDASTSGLAEEVFATVGRQP